MDKGHLEQEEESRESREDVGVVWTLMLLDNKMNEDG